MSNNNYTYISNEELLKTIQDLHIGQQKLNSYLKKHFSELFNELVKRTNFLNDYYESKSVPILARLYCIEHNIKEHPTCQNPYCSNHNKVEWRNGINQFAKYCCRKCSSQDPEYWKRHRKTMIEHWGVVNPGQSKEIRERVKRTCMEHYNVEYSFQAEEVKQKIKQSMMNNWNVDNPAKSKEIWDKRIQDCREKYGTDYTLQCECVKDKIKQTTLNNWDVEYIGQSEEVKQKIRQTNLLNRGVEWTFQDEIVKDKIRNTMLERYGVEYPLQSKSIQDKTKATNIKIRGVEYPVQSEEVKSKMTQTCLERYGVEYYSQTLEFAKKSHKPYMNPKYPDMTFGSSWEFLVYDFLLENNIKFEYQPSIVFDYVYDNKHHTYHPDFLINGKVYEVKGDQFFRINESTNQEEMFCPYRYKEWTDEQYEYLCGLFNAKHQCMLLNKVIILRHSHIKALSLDLFR